ncbi:MAG TPA: mannonate dehydratase [Bacteroidales bacterium]|nr:mannonate dehydratase [Bacteroidales bacterium]
MEKTWRWFGKNDSITLDMIRQIGVEGIVTALYEIPPGEIWTYEAIIELKNHIERNGLQWSVVESLPVPEEIKYGDKSRDQLIENYNISIANLGKAGIKTICYNFMPAIDWVRTDLEWKLPDGTYTLYFDKIRYAYFDCYILNREGAEKDYTDEEIEKVNQLQKVITKEEADSLIDTIIIRTQNFIHRKISNDNVDPVEEFKKLIAKYNGIDKNGLRQNMCYFLNKVIPTAENYGVKLAVHPDDPPFAVFGLPRIVSNEEDIELILKMIDSKSNGLTLCTGSLSAGEHNNLPNLARRFAKNIYFAHLRSTEILPNGNFIEASHLGGRGNIIEVIRILEKQNRFIPMRVDHGKLMLDDINKNHNPGYSFYGRMLALGQVEGMMAVVRNELDNI